MITLSEITNIPQYIFGTSSERVFDEAVACTAVSGASGHNVWYIVAMLSISALYLAWLNQWSIKGRNHISSFQFLGKHRGGYGAKVENIHPTYSEYARLASLIGYALVWVALLRTALNYDLSLRGAGNHMWLWIGATVPAIYVYQLLMVWAIAKTTHSADFRRDMLRLKAILFTIFTIVATPAILCYAANGDMLRSAIMYLSGALIVVLVLLYIYECFLLFLSKKVSILHTFLYLCTVEIFPITLIWGYFYR